MHLLKIKKSSILNVFGRLKNKAVNNWTFICSGCMKVKITGTQSMTITISTCTVWWRQDFAINSDMPLIVHIYCFSFIRPKKKFPAYLQFLRFSLCRQYMRTCPSLWTVERSESLAANRPEGRESGHNPTASKDSPQASGEAREEACLVTNSNTSYNKQPKSSLESHSNM